VVGDEHGLLRKMTVLVDDDRSFFKTFDQLPDQFEKRSVPGRLESLVSHRPTCLAFVNHYITKKG